MALQAGKLDRFVGLYHRVLTKNELGEDVESWPTAYANVWASKADALTSRRGTKEFTAEQFALLVFTEFKIRFRSDLLGTDHLVDDAGVTYEVIQSGEIGRREGINLLCRAIVS